MCPHMFDWLPHPTQYSMFAKPSTIVALSASMELYPAATVKIYNLNSLIK